MDCLGLGLAEADALILELNGDGVAERGDTDELDLHSRHEAKSEKTLVNGPCGVELHDLALLADEERGKWAHGGKCWGYGKSWRRYCPVKSD